MNNLEIYINLERKFLFSSVCGNTIYDKDKLTTVIFVAPSFNDLCDGRVYHRVIETYTNMDYHIYDIRKLTSMVSSTTIDTLEILFNTQINILEPEFSVQHETYDEYNKDIKINNYINTIFSIKDDLAKANLHGLFWSTSHMYDTMCRTKIVDKYNAYKILNFIIRFAQNDLDFNKSMQYIDSEREYQLKLKNNDRSKQDWFNIMNRNHNLFNHYKDFYGHHNKNKELINRVDSIVKDIVSLSI